MTLAIEADGLVKSFGDTRAVDGIDLSIRAGTVYGVLGPNGAGKTTTIRMLATLLRPDAGTARVLGHDIVTDAAAVRGKMSLTGQFASVDEELTGRENLLLIGRLLGLGKGRAADRAASLLDAFGLPDAADKLVRDYSGGMRRRLDLASSIVVTPELLFLDEPTTGLDPRSRNQVWDIVRVLVGRGRHRPADDAVPGRGRPAGRPAGHHRPRPGDRRRHAGRAEGIGGSRLAARPRRRDRRALGRPAGAGRGARRAGAAGLGSRRASSAADVDADRAAAALGALSRAGITVAELSLGQPSLDEVFLALTGHPAESAPNGHDVQEDAA